MSSISEIQVSLSSSFDGLLLDLPSWLASTICADLLLGVELFGLYALGAFGITEGILMVIGAVCVIHFLFIQLALYVRRMHYRNKSGWNLMWFFGVPIFCFLSLFSRDLLAGAAMMILIPFQDCFTAVGLLKALQVDYREDASGRARKVMWNILALLLCIIYVIVSFMAKRFQAGEYDDSRFLEPPPPAVSFEYDDIQQTPPLHSAGAQAVPTSGAFWHSKNLQRQWEKSGRGFPECSSLAQYEQKSLAFFGNPPAGTLFKTRTNGDRIYYHQASNTFGVTTKSGSVKCFFRPREGAAIWQKQ